MFNSDTSMTADKTGIYIVRAMDALAAANNMLNEPDNLTNPDLASLRAAVRSAQLEAHLAQRTAEQISWPNQPDDTQPLEPTE